MSVPHEAANRRNLALVQGVHGGREERRGDFWQHMEKMSRANLNEYVLPDIFDLLTSMRDLFY